MFGLLSVGLLTLLTTEATAARAGYACKESKPVPRGWNKLGPANLSHPVILVCSFLTGQRMESDQASSRKLPSSSLISLSLSVTYSRYPIPSTLDMGSISNSQRWTTLFVLRRRHLRA